MNDERHERLQEWIDRSSFHAYAYGYPHKTAYRPLEPPTSWRRAWEMEEKDRLFLYVHVPFCAVRCGFCNLFTTTHADDDLVGGYLDAVDRQMAVAADALGADARFTRCAIGGGTPTFLAAGALERLFDGLERRLHFAPAQCPTSVETSPDTATADRLHVLAQRGVERLSIGVQSFVDQDCGSMGRPQKSVDAMRALEAIRRERFAVVNIDLMYGAEGQTERTLMSSVKTALRFTPEELYLYPLYVRRLTGLGRRARNWDDQRIAQYRAARDGLLGSGYEQVSMRMFRRSGIEQGEPPPYSCQRDGMVGLGAGARSYTRALHYSTEYGVSQEATRDIVVRFARRSRADLETIPYGFQMTADETLRRFVVQSLLQSEGLDDDACRTSFGAGALDLLPQLTQLFDLDLATWHGRHLTLNARGLELSDVIGPWLGSAHVRHLMASYAWR